MAYGTKPFLKFTEKVLALATLATITTRQQLSEAVLTEPSDGMGKR